MAARLASKEFNSLTSRLRNLFLPFAWGASLPHGLTLCLIPIQPRFLLELLVHDLKMASNNGAKRSNPFVRTASTSPAPGNSNRPKSMVLPPASPGKSPPVQSHNRNQSFSNLSAIVLPPHSSANSLPRRGSGPKNAQPASNTFAPSFIKTEEMQRGVEVVKSIEGENDFSGKRYVWLKDPQAAFVRGWVVEELGSNQILVQCDDGSVGLHTTQTLTPSD